MTNRWLKDSGFAPLLAYITLPIGFFALSIYLFSKTEYAEYAYLFFAMTLIVRLSETRRMEFLEICFGNRQMKIIRMIENFICAIPFLCFLLYKQLFVSAGLLILLTAMLAMVNFRTTLHVTMRTPFSKTPFEFSTGFRNTFYLFLVAYLLTIIAIVASNFNLGVFAMLLVFATILGYYSKPEHEYYVWVHNTNPRHFLLGKIKTALLFSASLALPIALVLSIFFYRNISMILLFYIVGWAFLIAMIVAKYSAYPSEMNIPHIIILAICLWFPPSLLILIPYLFRKSENKLASLLK